MVKREGKEQLVTRLKRGVECAGQWVVGIWAKFRVERPTLVWNCLHYRQCWEAEICIMGTVDTGHSDDRDKQRQIARCWLLCFTIYRRNDV